MKFLRDGSEKGGKIAGNLEFLHPNIKLKKGTVMNFVLKTLFIFSGFALLISNSEAAIILKTKNKQALIHLEGLKTKKGAYFDAINLYGEKKGIVQIKRVGNKKAIGVLKLGLMEKRWSLEPTSKSKALAAQKRAKRKAKMARIQREKIKRKLAQRKKGKRRAIASYQEEYISSEPTKDSDYQSQEVLSNNFSYNGPSDSGNASSSDQYDRDQNTNLELQDVYTSPETKRFFLGVAPRFEYSFINVTPRKSPGYLMHGLGYGFFTFVDFSLNHLIRTEGSLGFKRFSVFADEEDCGKRSGCSLKINYVSAGLNLKLNAAEFNNHKMWLAFKGVLMHPLVVSNKALFKESSFQPFHGTLGGTVGMDFNMGRTLIIPVSMGCNIQMPPTETTMAFNVELQVGLAYKL